MNILIAPNQDQGYALIDAMGADRTKWQVISYCGQLLSFRPEVLVIIHPSLDDFSAGHRTELLRWTREDLPLIAARAKKVVEIG
jgi:hypothetical protein